MNPYFKYLTPVVLVGGLLFWTISTADTESPEKPATTNAQTAMTEPTDNSEYKRPSEEELRAKLTPMQFQVACNEGTEPAFRNEYWDNKKPGIYVDVISGKALFASVHKYDSGTGWPSFWQPIDEEEIVENVDTSAFMTRTEVKSKTGETHLGHLFPDGPNPTGMRYCINSAALRFVPLDEMKERGYGKYLPLFDKAEKTKAE